MKLPKALDVKASPNRLLVHFNPANISLEYLCITVTYGCQYSSDLCTIKKIKTVQSEPFVKCSGP